MQTVDRATNPRFAKLIESFERLTDCPILLNTSFNMNYEPIVCTPVDALMCFIRSGLDALALEDFLIDRSSLSILSQLILRKTAAAPSSAVTHQTYTLF